MPITPGARLGPYEIVSAIGAGGMGEVYRARDTRLDRTVAIKVLPDALAQNLQLKLRFEREAKAISALAHPNICTVHDVGSHEGVEFLVMEHLEGENLAQRLERGPLGVAEALRLAIDVADALDRAHRAGIVHRDLKPGNVMITKNGAKLLDFGLARSIETEAVSADSLTLRAPATAVTPLTAEGTIVGTFQYMAPEQIEGRPADARTDIFAFGALLYEMLTQKRAFDGKSRASVIAAILAAEPQSIAAVRPLTPAALDRVVSIALRKDPDERWQSIHDVKLELEALLATALEPPPKDRRASMAGWVAAGLLAAAAVGGAVWDRRANHVPPQTVRFEITPPAGARFNAVDGPAIISPDGQKIVTSMVGDDLPQGLVIRAIDSTEFRPLKGTEGAYDPFWSPDSRHLAFFANGRLKKIDVTTGAMSTIATLSGDARAGAWGPDGTILYASTAVGPLSMIRPGQSVPEQATTLDTAARETGHWRPAFLPGGKRFLYISINAVPEQSGVFVGEIGSPRRKKILGIPTPAFYVAPGYLLFYNEGNVYGQPFDLDDEEASGEPFVVARNVAFTAQFAVAAFSISNNGTMVYNLQGKVPEGRISRIDLATAAETPFDVQGFNIDPSRDGTRLAFGKADPQSRSTDIWTFDLRRAVATRFTFDQGEETGPVWSPDDRRIAYVSTRQQGQQVLIRDLNGGGVKELGKPFPAGIEIVDWSRDGRTLLAEVWVNDNRMDLFTMDAVSGEARPFVSQPFLQSSGRFSPDGKWIAYTSDDSGRTEIYVQPFPADGSKWQVTSGGGDAPRWTRDGKSLFYVAGDGRLTSVPVVLTAGRFETGTPRSHAKINTRDYVLNAGETEAIFSLRESPEALPLIVSTKWR